jgi:hypothetical protein
MITFYDQFTQMVVSQTIHAELVQGLRDDEPREGWIPDPDGVRTLTNLVLVKMMLTHRTYELVASPRASQTRSAGVQVALTYLIHCFLGKTDLRIVQYHLI